MDLYQSRTTCADNTISTTTPHIAEAIQLLGKRLVIGLEAA